MSQMMEETRYVGRTAITEAVIKKPLMTEQIDEGDSQYPVYFFRTLSLTGKRRVCEPSTTIMLTPYGVFP